MPLKIKSNMSRTSTSLLACGALAVALLGVSMGVASAQNEQPRAADERKQETHLGTYEPQRVFQATHYATTLAERAGELQQQALEAQAEGNQQRMMEIQGRMQAVQSEVVQAFLSEVDTLVPEIAQESGVKIVALEVVWVDPEIGEPKDLSGELIAQINENNNGEQAPPQRPPFEAPGR